jgi:hypothetical protein
MAEVLDMEVKDLLPERASPNGSAAILASLILAFSTGVTRTAIRLVSGNARCKSSNDLAAKSTLRSELPSYVAAGLRKDLTNPSPIGSPTSRLSKGRASPGVSNFFAPRMHPESCGQTRS